MASTSSSLPEASMKTKIASGFQNVNITIFLVQIFLKFDSNDLLATESFSEGNFKALLITLYVFQ